MTAGKSINIHCAFCRLMLTSWKYFIEKRGSKVSELFYTDLKMDDYLHPSNNDLITIIYGKQYKNA